MKPHTHDGLEKRIVHDHEHLNRIFEGLATSLNEVIETGCETSDFLEDVRADLAFALDEMLDHFGIEEEAIFQYIREAVPALGGEIDTLEQQHEGLCAGTARLRKMVAAAEGGYKPLDLGLARTLVQESQQLLLTHNDREVRVFLDAFHGMDEAGRQLLAKDLNRL